MRISHIKEGDIREKEFFALFPVRVGHETRWLEMINIKQIALKRHYPYWFQADFTWETIKFLD